MVARLFDHDLAARVERRLQIGATRSVSMLAAPAFAAAAVGRRSEVIFPVGRRVLLFTEITVSAQSAAPGRTVRELDQPGLLPDPGRGPDRRQRLGVGSRRLTSWPAANGWPWWPPGPGWPDC